MGRIAILGGTGPEGVGLALRLAQAGEEVAIGSRDRQRAVTAAGRVTAALPSARVRGDVNERVIPGADFVALCFPFEGLEPFLSKHGRDLAGVVVIDVVNALVSRNGTFRPQPVPEGSAALHIQRLAPEARVVSAFKTISAEHLKQLDEPLEGDVLMCGDDPDAVSRVQGLVARVPNLRPLNTGPLANASMVEGITALLLNLNRRYKATTSVRIVGID